MVAKLRMKHILKSVEVRLIRSKRYVIGFGSQP